MKRQYFFKCHECSLGQPFLPSTGGKCLRCNYSNSIDDDSLAEEEEEAVGSIAREGKTALLIALQFSGLPDVFRGAILLSYLVMPTTIVPVILWRQGQISNTTALFAALGIFLIAVLWLNSLRVFLSKRALRVVMRRIQKACFKGELSSECPQCQLNIAAAPFDCSFACPSCQLELLTADGVIVTRSERESNRVAAWTLRAKDLVDADRMSQSVVIARSQHISKAIVIVNIVLPIASIAWLLLG